MNIDIHVMDGDGLKIEMLITSFDHFLLVEESYKKPKMYNKL